MEALLLFLGEVGREDHLHALGADEARQRGEDALLAILAGHEGGDVDDGVLVVQDGRADASRAVGDGVLGALLALVDHVAALLGTLLDLGLVEAELLGVLLGELLDGLAGDGGRLPGGDLAEAVLADDVGVDGLGAHAGDLGNLGAQAGGVEAAAGADDLGGVVAGEVPDGGADDVAGVGDIDEDALEAAAHDGLGEGAGRVGGVEQLAVAVGGRKRDVARAVDDDVAVGEVLVAVGAVDDARVVGHEADGVDEVLGLGDDLLVVRADEVELVGDALEQQAVRHVGAYVSESDDADLSLRRHTGSLPRFVPFQFYPNGRSPSPLMAKLK